jgi:omega-6 fatty acid desaturase (delta-12 desaturase)
MTAARISIAKEHLRKAMARHHGHSNAPGLLSGAFDLAGYVCCFLLLAQYPWWPIAIPLAIVQTIFIARLFVLGHDACHGSLFPSRFWNRTVGRVLFLPSLTPYTPWEFGHNSVHHGFSNLKGTDYVWMPFSPQEWVRLPQWRRLLERLYRCPAGLGVYYFVEIWWKKLSFAGLRSTTPYRPAYFWDNLLNTAFLAAVSAASYWIGARHGAPLAAVWFAVLLPFALWNYLMSFAIYCHHTHPDVKWFENREEWSFYEAQVCATTHTRFRSGFDRLFHNIFEHTAHHVDTAIPFYALPTAQEELEELCGPDIVRVEAFSLRQFLAQMRMCQLYDYRKHRWIRFRDVSVAERALVD